MTIVNESSRTCYVCGRPLDGQEHCELTEGRVHADGSGYVHQEYGLCPSCNDAVMDAMEALREAHALADGTGRMEGTYVRADAAYEHMPIIVKTLRGGIVYDVESAEELARELMQAIEVVREG